MDKFESAVLFALQRLDSHDIILKPEQKEAVRMVWEGNDVFVLLPTGFGKSIINFTRCYRLFWTINLTEWMGRPEAWS